jgi:hypothetical protein
MVIALVMVTAPYPAGSIASISPPAAVLEIAPAKVLHGAVRLQGFASSPTPDTQVREAWPYSMVVPSNTTTTDSLVLLIFIVLFLPFKVFQRSFHYAEGISTTAQLRYRFIYKRFLTPLASEECWQTVSNILMKIADYLRGGGQSCKKSLSASAIHCLLEVYFTNFL